MQSYRGDPSAPLPEAPPAPRKPGPLAKSIALADTPAESNRLFHGGAFLAVAALIAVTMGWGIPGEMAFLIGSAPAEGVVTSNAKGSNRINKRDATKIVYRYQVAGQGHEGSHDTIDDTLISRAAVGKPIAIEVVPFWPSMSRIRGESYSFFGLLVLPMILLLGAVGAVKFLPAWRVRRRRWAAFRKGVPARGRIVTRNGDADASTRRIMGVIEYEYAVGGRTIIGALWGENQKQTASSFPRDDIIVFHDPRDPSAHAVWIEDDFDSLEG